VQRPFHLKHKCDACGAVFKREEGFFVGAIMANVVATEFVILAAYFVCLLFTRMGDQTLLGILFVVGVGFPLAFYHHAWALWLGIDHLIEGLPSGSGSRK
jgi:rubredoxin